MNADRDSDEFVVPATSANNEATKASAESMQLSSALSQADQMTPSDITTGAYLDDLFAD